MENNRTKIRIVVGNSYIEIEGTEDYIEKKLKETESFAPLMERLGGATTSSSTTIEGAKPRGKPGTAKKKKPVSRVPESYNVLPDLDLAGKDNIPSLKDFYKNKNPGNAMESNAVFIYYLKRLRKINKIGINHVYSCYKNVEAKAPKALYQSLADTRKAKGWIITTNMDDIGIGIGGENFVELELPKTKKSDK
jgi:hypothetical protein